jgi:hypothetical protein
MALVNYVPITDPIQEVITTFKFNDSAWLPHAITWGFEALKAMRCQYLVKSLSKKIVVNNYVYTLPEAFIGMRGVELENGNRLTLDPDVTITHETPDSNVFYITAPDIVTVNPTPETFATYDNNSRRVDLGLAYNIDGNDLILNTKTASVIIHYNAWHVDKNNILLVPDLYSVRQAIYWYIVKNLLIAGYTNPVINYQHADEKLTLSIRDAKRALKAPNFDEAMTAMTTFVRLVPAIVEGFNFGKGLNNLQVVEK